MISSSKAALPSASANLDSGVPWQRVLLGVVMSGLVVLTVMGNVLMIVVVARYKRLHTVFNAYIVNLAVTDVSVAITAMSFFVIEKILHRWPFGMVMCGVWIFFDFGMTFCSVFTLVAISVDRYWSVTWSHSYRRHNNWRKATIFIAAVWCSMLVLWVPAFVVDRVNNSRGDGCFFDPEKNRAFSIILLIFACHGPTIIMLYCYIKVYLFIRRLRKTRPLVRSSPVSALSCSACTSVTSRSFQSHAGATPARDAETEVDEEDESLVAARSEGPSFTTTVENTVGVVQDSTCPSKIPQSTVGTLQISTCPALSSQTIRGAATDSISPTAETDKDKAAQSRLSQTPVGQEIANQVVIVHDAVVTTALLTEADKEYTRCFNADSEGTFTSSTLTTTVDTDQDSSVSAIETKKKETSYFGKSKVTVRKKTAGQRANPQARYESVVRREQRAFKTVTCVLGGFLVCWLPAYVTFNIMAIDLNLVPEWLQNLTYFMTYCNSTINPFLFSFGNTEFHAAFRKILRCRRP